ncbi:MAG: tRNA epoxyqueuosine(34) reductase QueG [Bacteroidota bacterium]
MVIDLQQKARFLREKAHELGFDQVGIAQATELTEEAHRLEAWLNQNYQGDMHWMGNHFEKRIDPRKLVPGAKTVVSLLYNYFPEQEQQDPDAPKIARYAYGKDYHHVLKRKLKTLLQQLQDEFGTIEGRCFVDSAPVMEREWAKRSGLGWLGKNTLLIHPKKGSYFFLAELIIDLELPADQAIRDHCGTCTRCIDACPTDAIAPDGYLLDARKCISYLTIELKNAIPDSFAGQFENWTFGCDICQEVCPWNRFSTPHSEDAFTPHPDLLEMKVEDWHEITEDVFRTIFKHSAVKRTKYAGLKRNLAFLKKKNPDEGLA